MMNTELVTKVADNAVLTTTPINAKLGNFALTRVCRMNNNKDVRIEMVDKKGAFPTRFVLTIPEIDRVKDKISAMRLDNLNMPPAGIECVDAKLEMIETIMAPYKYKRKFSATYKNMMLYIAYPSNIEFRGSSVVTAVMHFVFGSDIDTMRTITMTVVNNQQTINAINCIIG